MEERRGEGRKEEENVRRVARRLVEIAGGGSGVLSFLQFIAKSWYKQNISFKSSDRLALCPKPLIQQVRKTHQHAIRHAPTCSLVKTTSHQHQIQL